jgi:hypothetical protein
MGIPLSKGGLMPELHFERLDPGGLEKVPVSSVLYFVACMGETP